MRLKLLSLSLSCIFLFSYCANEEKVSDGTSTWISPEAGKSVNLGDTVSLSVNLKDQADSVVYYADGARLAHAKGDEKVSMETGKLPLGIKAITAKIYREGTESEAINTNIVLKSTLVPKKFSYRVVQEIKHDTSSYTQGLEFHKGFLYESDGLYGESSIRKVDPATGEVLLMTPVSDDKFAEGITVIGDKILMLTYRENVNMEYDLKTLKLIREYPTPYVREGWGLCNDGEKIYNSDGTNVIHVLNKDTYMQERSIEVYDHNGTVWELNELEYIEGQIFANVYNSNRIVMINPVNGQVTGEVDLSDLYPDEVKTMKDFDGFVLNGIAWDAAGKRMYVTGKKWDKMFQIELR
jgi:glutamine cyclotransferase